MRTDIESFRELWGVDITGIDEANIPKGYTTQWNFVKALAEKEPSRIVNEGMVKALFGITK